VRGESTAKIKDGKKPESESSERSQGWGEGKPASRGWQVWPGKGERRISGV